MITDDKIALLALSRVSGLGPSRLGHLLTSFGDVAGIQSASFSSLKAAGCNTEMANEIQQLEYAMTPEEADWLAHPEHHLITIDHPEYPVALKGIDQAPVVLFAKGNMELMNGACLGMVGTRNPTKLGAQTAELFANQLAKAGITVVSGLALGIDAASHQGAVREVGSTVAVMACGLDRVYPARNRAIAHEIAQHGLLLSEFAPGVQARPEYFPRRNRIISGLSLGVLVVEAAMKSGTLVTARYASEQGREVFAIPGSIHTPTARGCHWLIKQGAKLVESADDILEEIQPKLAAYLLDQKLTEDAPDKASQALTEFDPSYQDLLKAMNFDSVMIDELVTKTGLTAAEVSSMLLLLEMEGVVISANGRYQRIG